MSSKFRRPNVKPAQKDRSEKRSDHVELHIPLKAKTASNLAALNAEVQRTQDAAQRAADLWQAGVMPILTEHEFTSGRVLNITEKEPFEIVIAVPRAEAERAREREGLSITELPPQQQAVLPIKPPKRE